MDISTEILSLSRYGTNKEILKLLKDAGFEAYDFTMYGLKEIDAFIDKEDYLERAKDLRLYADSINIRCNQCHSYFPTIRIEDRDNKLGLLYTKRSIEVAGILGAKAIVVHATCEFTAKENANTYNELLDTAKKSNVKIALENLFNYDSKLNKVVPCACSSPESLLEHLSLLDKDWFCACLDIGHAELNGLDTSSAEMINKLGNKLKCLHIHDNDMKHDNHKLPYIYWINYEPIIEALANSEYDGDLTFECLNYYAGFPKKVYPAAAKLMYDIGCYFREEILRRRKK